MKSFVIHEIKKKLKLSDVISLDGGFKYVLKSSNLGVKEIIILDSYIIDQLILANFNRRYKKILEYYIATLQNEDSDSSEGNFMISLDEIARLRSILIKKYSLIVSRKIEEKMLKKLKILENEIRMKVIDIKLIKERECVHTISEPDIGKSR